MTRPPYGPPRLTLQGATPRLHAVTTLDESPATTNGDGGLGTLIRSFAEQAAAETALLVVMDGEQGELARVRATWGLNVDPGDIAVRRGEGAAGRVLERGRCVTAPLETPEGDPLADAASGAEVGFAIGAPVRSSKGIAGALCAGLSRRPQAERGQLKWTAESYAAVAALCLDGTGLLGALLEAARRDPLTGALNYAALEERIREEAARSERYGHNLACCFIDLDDFKGINDKHGHLVGNRVLAAVAGALKEGVRSPDGVARYGGDEFVVLLPNTARAAALALAHRLQERIATAASAAAGTPIGASVGVADWQAGTPAEEMLERADEALRIAKRFGASVIVAPGSGDGARPSASPRRAGDLVGAVRRLLPRRRTAR